MTFQPLFPVMRGYVVTAPGFMLRILFDVLIGEPVVLFFKMRPPVISGLNSVLRQNFLHAVDT